MRRLLSFTSSRAGAARSAIRLLQLLALSGATIILNVCDVGAESVRLSVDGRERSYLIERPAGDAPRPTIIMLHGFGGTAADDCPPHRPRPARAAKRICRRVSRWAAQSVEPFPARQGNGGVQSGKVAGRRRAGRCRFPQILGCRSRPPRRLRSKAHLSCRFFKRGLHDAAHDLLQFGVVRGGRIAGQRHAGSAWGRLPSA